MDKRSSDLLPEWANAITERMKNMTPEENKESLIRAGIIDKDGKLTKHYRTSKKELREHQKHQRELAKKFLEKCLKFLDPKDSIKIMKKLEIIDKNGLLTDSFKDRSFRK